MNGTTAKDTLTGNDNSYELILVGGGLVLCIGLIMSLYDLVVLDHAFDVRAYCWGFGGLLTGVGFGYGGKKFGDRFPTANGDTDDFNAAAPAVVATVTTPTGTTTTTTTPATTTDGWRKVDGNCKEI